MASSERLVVLKGVLLRWLVELATILAGFVATSSIARSSAPSRQVANRPKSRLVRGAGAAALGAGQTAEQGGELAGLLGVEMLEEQPADAAHVGAARVAQLGQPLIGQLRVGHARVAGAGGALDESAGHQAV